MEMIFYLGAAFPLLYAGKYQEDTRKAYQKFPANSRKTCVSYMTVLCLAF
jgi:hypothetical protein